MDRKVTIFKDITDSKNAHYISIQNIVERIGTGKHKELVEKIRTIKDKSERDKFKKQLPSICFSGIFDQRGNNHCKSHSGLVAIDFDHLDNYDEFRKQIIKDKYTFLAFRSPSGDGLKIVVKIPAEIKTHHLSCKALAEYYKNEKLDSFEDIARVCYISYDPEIYMNHQSEIFTSLAVQKTVKRFDNVGYESDYDVIFDKLTGWLDKSDVYTDGNKHKYLVKLAGACNRFGIPRVSASQKIIYTYQNKATFVKSDDIEKIVNDVYSNYSHQNGISHFEKSGLAYDTVTKVELTERFFNEVEIASKDIIYLDNVRESMIEGFHTGKARGKTTYFEDFDKHWTWRKKEVTFVSGIGNMGKSIWVLQLALLRAVFDGEKFGIFSPEQDPADDLYNDLIHMYIGKSTEPYHSNQMTFAEYEKGMDFIKDHFFYVHPENDSPTPAYINKCFEVLINKHKIDGCITDPFNQLDNDWKKYNRDDQYISEFLTTEKSFAQKYDVYKIIVGHPIGAKLSRDKHGDYEYPKVYDYAGGSMWNNKADNILCYHRPFATSQPGNPCCNWMSQKIKKRKLVGVPGMIEMSFDIMSNRFKDSKGYNPLETEKINKLNPDELNFNDIPDIDF
ncbi:BT4734/BF3469 family protein [Massilibacteroides sp.]|uniref:BT4734/BF3469 family protein n=1 Tax=Massilibacteroides sp. TaxID=2034766 RepID=UPI00260FF16E|nr:BT4734/BF3469 family protein [Massilibacteroides sp.]MDD4515669.1 BT4734/BF3469 family protein [Massilibacteroides sp.]